MKKKQPKQHGSAAGGIWLWVGETKRLKIAKVPIMPPECQITRLLYIAFEKGDGYETRVCILAHAIVCPVPVFGFDNLDWLEVTSDMRRQGFGREFREWIATRHPTLTSEPVTPEGIAFREAIDAK